MRAFLPLVLLALGACRATGEVRAEALGAARWLESSAQRTDAGLTWVAVPAEGGPPDRTLYAGAPGVVLFFVELWHATQDAHWLELACLGADDLLAHLPEHATGEAAGLYTGLAGVGAALGEVWRASGDERHRAGLARVLEVLTASASAAPGLPGRAWGTTNDLIAGTAGIGLFALRAEELLGDGRGRALAREAATRLVALAEPTAHGLDWPMEPSFPRRMPNFSHGTAGIATFLARAGSLAAARAGAEHVVALAERADGLRVYHHAPGGEQLFYLGWCHGPAGTAGLFGELAAATGEPRWAELEGECARALVTSGLPARRLEGFWDNVARCCGSAGVVDCFLRRHARTGAAEDLTFARRVADDLVARATSGEHGLAWIQAEHRARPELRQAQTGLMQGAAGIGLVLLRLDAVERGRAPFVVLPDDPRAAASYPRAR